MAAVQGDQAELIHSLNIDINEELNPVKKINNMIKWFTYEDKKYEEGIWIGRRNLLSGITPVSFSVGYNKDIAH